jgi:hypothetical protein
MKKVVLLLVGVLTFLLLTSCERVAPNYYGVLMENYGKNGKEDYSKQQGRVNTMSPGTELFQVPAWEQRGVFTDEEGKDVTLNIKAADNTAFSSKPLYSYKVIPNKVVDVVFQNARLGSGDDFMVALQDNVLEPRIYDIIKEASRSYSTEQLMANGGSLKFEEYVQEIVKTEFEKSGLELISFSLNLDFSKKVKAKIDSRNEVNTNISVLDQQIAEQRKRNELETLRAEQNKIRSSGITPQLLQEKALTKWDGKLPSTYSGGPLPFVKTVN